MYDDLDRPPLRMSVLARALGPQGWRVQVERELGSTNAALLERAVAGEPAGLVLVAESQTAGRGRLDRSWVSPPRAGLTFSVLLRAELPEGRLPWLPLLAGVAVALALREQAGLPAQLKWPNDVLVGDRKLAGLLAQTDGRGAAVLGIGLNVTTRPDELPPGPASSVRAEGGTTTDRETLLKAVLRALSVQLDEQDLDSYRQLSATIGRRVRVELPGGETREGTAERVDDLGRLVVGGTPYSAGDVVHLRS